jgi:hypothetical protein
MRGSTWRITDSGARCLARQRHLGVWYSPQRPCAPQDPRRVFLLAPPYRGIAAERRPGDEHVPNARAALRGEHAAAAVFDVVGMRAEREMFTIWLRREGDPFFLTENAEGLIALHQ